MDLIFLYTKLIFRIKITVGSQLHYDWRHTTTCSLSAFFYVYSRNKRKNQYKNVIMKKYIDRAVNITLALN